MNLVLAEKLIDLTKKADAVPGELGETARQIEDEAEQRKILRAAAELMLHVYEKITQDIVRQYPDLHPDKDVAPLVRKRLEGKSSSE